MSGELPGIPVAEFLRTDDRYTLNALWGKSFVPVGESFEELVERAAGMGYEIIFDEDFGAHLIQAPEEPQKLTLTVFTRDAREGIVPYVLDTDLGRFEEYFGEL